MTRSEFLRLFAGLGALTLAAGCKKSEDDTPVDAPAARDGAPVDSPPGTVDAPATGCTAAVGSNHGHSIAVPQADVTAGAEKSYNIQGGSDHPHEVVVTAAMFTMLQQKKAVTVESSEDEQHSHTVTITCA